MTPEISPDSTPDPGVRRTSPDDARRTRETAGNKLDDAGRSHPATTPDAAGSLEEGSASGVPRLVGGERGKPDAPTLDDGHARVMGEARPERLSHLVAQLLAGTPADLALDELGEPDMARGLLAGLRTAGGLGDQLRPGGDLRELAARLQRPGVDLLDELEDRLQRTRRLARREPRVPKKDRPKCGARLRGERAGRTCEARVCDRPDGRGLAKRCRQHGGLSTLAKTPEGRQRQREGGRRGAEITNARKRATKATTESKE